MPQDWLLGALGIFENSLENEMMMLFGRMRCRNSIASLYVNELYRYLLGTPLVDLFE